MDSRQILQHYLGIRKIPITIQSPFRDDKVESFAVFSTRSGKVKYKDLATGDTGDGIDLVMKLNNISYGEAMDKIRSEVEGGIADAKTQQRLHYTQGAAYNPIETTAYRKHPKATLQYWNDYTITKQDLADEGNISSLMSFKVGDKTIYAGNNIVICYTWYYKNKVYKKIYQPLNKKYKWLNNMRGVSGKIIHNLNKLDRKLGYLIITKSVKDVIVIKKAGYLNVIGTQAEGLYLEQPLLNKLIGIFPNIYILYDNDWEKRMNRGQLYAKEILRKYPNFVNIVLPDITKVTDASDMVKHYNNTNKLKQLLDDNIKFNDRL